MTLNNEIDQYRLWNKFVLEGGPLPPLTSPWSLGHILTFIDDVINSFKKINLMVTIPAAEYVPALGDIMLECDNILSQLDKEIEQ